MTEKEIGDPDDLLADFKLRITPGIRGLKEPLVIEALMKAADFSDFNEDNDPWEEHDFGAFTLSNGIKCFFKWSYYDSNLEFFGHSAHVLTLMHASEY